MNRYKRKFTESIPKAPAYWISPAGKILPIMNEDNHIAQVIKKPKAFGFTIEEIQKMYDEEGEQPGIEGRARERIIKQIILNGWIRIRRYMREDTFSINMNGVNSRNIDLLFQWASAMCDHGLQYSQVRLDLPGEVIDCSVGDIAGGRFLPENNQQNLRR